jgi:hypothetical protein
MKEFIVLQQNSMDSTMLTYLSINNVNDFLG